MFCSMLGARGIFPTSRATIEGKNGYFNKISAVQSRSLQSVQCHRIAIPASAMACFP